VSVHIQNNWDEIEELLGKERRAQAMENIGGILDDDADMPWDEIMDL